VVEHATVELKVCGLSESQTNHIRRISSEEIERKGLKDQTIAYLPQGVPTEVLKRIVEEVLTEEQKQVAKKNVVRLKP
jgi:hypothetical protein